MSRQDYSHKAREYRRKRDEAKATFQQNLEAIEAASVFAQRLSKMVDAWAGPHPLWHGWAITAAEYWLLHNGWSEL